MANNPYEVEHNIKAPTRPPHRRRPDMSSFDSLLHQIQPNSTSHVGPTPVDLEGLLRLVQEQLATLSQTAPTPENRDLLERMFNELQGDIDDLPDTIKGVSQEYLDMLDRVPRKKIGDDDVCPICAERCLDDPHPLVVELPCDGHHRFDLECIGPWLLSKGTCPMCRKDLTKKKVIEIPKDDGEEEDDMDGLYG
ncbi:hypothetical protein GGS26DRAFT_568611 [Hypomontagnella submonticulosa]|nr:hypothetical protein GGS26DRAFT_568611 [Hypomontagnella submonticulosa]